MLAVLKNERFRTFLLADLISYFGFGLTTLGASLYVLEVTSSPKHVGFMVTCSVLSGLVTVIFVVAIIDRFDRKRVIYGSFFVRALMLFILFMLFAVQGFSVFLIYALGCTIGSGWNVYLIVSKSFIQELIPKKDLLNGNALSEMSMQVGLLIAGGTAGIIYEFRGFNSLLVLNMVTFILSGIMVYRIRHKTILNESKLSFGSNFIQGLSYLKKQKLIFGLGMIAVVPVVVANLYSVVLPAYVAQLTDRSFVYGLADMKYGIGGLISSFLAGAWLKKIPKEQVILLLFGVSVLYLVLLGTHPTMLMLYLGSLMLGLSHSWLRIVLGTLLMEQVNSFYMGRATAVWTGISLLIQAMTSSGIGLAIDEWGAGFGFLMMAWIMVMGGLSFVWIENVLTKKHEKKSSST